jgi:hypothetical protein
MGVYLNPRFAPLSNELFSIIIAARIYPSTKNQTKGN